MTQEDLLEWVKAYECTETHNKKGFYRVVNKEGQAMGIPQPRSGHNSLQPMTICRICTMLKVPIPDYAATAFAAYTQLQKDHEDGKSGDKA